MTASALLEQLRGLGVELHGVGDRLRINAPEGVLTPAVRALLAEHKDEILGLLRSQDNFHAARHADAGDDILEMSFTQERLWFLDRLDPNSPGYNIPLALRRRGPLQIEALHAALKEVLRRHEALRTVCKITPEGPRQKVLAPASLPLPVIDLSSLAEKAAEEAAQRAAIEQFSRSFDLTCGPLVRHTLIRIAESHHMLVLTTHHFVADGWSVQLVLEELNTLYHAFARSCGSPLPAASNQFRDFVRWQHRFLRGPVARREMDYWKTRLTPPPPVLDLPTDRPRRSPPTFHGGAQSFEVATDLADRLKVLARSERTTLFMALLAAFRALLYRYSHQEDACIGTAVSNRNRPEWETIVGPMSNNLAVRIRCSGDLAFRELLARTRQVVVEAFTHQDLPFEQVVKEIQPERDATQNPIFQVMFMLQGAGRTTETADSLFVLDDIDPGIAIFDLALAMVDGSALHGTLQYNSALFQSATAARMVEHFTILLAAAVTQPEAPLSTLRLLADQERRQVMQDWNATESPFPHEATIQELVEAQVEKTPEAVAVVFGDRQMSYRELNGLANRLARHLRTAGVRPETAVGIYLGRSLEMVAGMLAILKSGGACLPLDPSYPAERLAFMLNDARVQYLVTEQKQIPTLPDLRVHRIPIDTGWPEISVQDCSNLAPIASSMNLAGIIYTSGSTGEPKGSLLSHRGLVNHLCWRQSICRLEPNDAVLQASPISFDIALWDFFGPLIAGARIVVPQSDAPPDSRQIVRLIRQQDITTLQLVPSRLQALMQEPDVEQCASLRCIVTGGEPLSLDLQERVLRSFPNLHNLYGATEASVDVTSYRCHPREFPHSVPIGHPIANQGVYLLGANLEPAPIGVAGEIFIRGQGLSRGYLRRPALTAERFLPDPFSAEPGGRLYRTGDQARWQPDGNLQFLGRIDNQVKVRGHRIELEEIEAVLDSCAGVHKSVALVREDTPGDQRVVAYVAGGTGLDVGALRSILRQRMPLFMVPSIFVVLDAIPVTTSGKVDRRALPAPDLRQIGQAIYVAPSNPVEELVALVWAEVLGAARVGVNDNFFELGGHSLLAAKVIARLAERFSLEIPLRVLFEQPTVAALGEYIRQAREAATGATIPPLHKAHRSAEIPLSFAQERLWFLDQLGPGGPPSRIPSLFRVEGPLDARALQRSLEEIVRRHESLRTTFTPLVGKPVQLISIASSVPLPIVDLEVAAPELQHREIRRLVDNRLQEPWDLSRGPLFQAILVRLRERGHVLIVFVHHIVADGWSISILFRELATLYESFLRGQASPLPELPFQYADYSVWQREWLHGDVLSGLLTYWRQQLAGAEVLKLLTDQPRPLQQTYRGGRRTFQIAGYLVESITALCRREGITPFMLLLANLMVLLHRYAGQSDVSVGTPVAHRPKTELEGLIGLFLNQLVLRGRPAGSLSFLEFLSDIREICLNAYAHQSLPFEKLVQELNVQRSLNRSPLFQVMFVLHSQPAHDLRLGDLQVVPEEVDIGSVTFDLILSMTPAEKALGGSVEYNADLFDATTIERMLRHFEVLLSGAVSRPLTALRDLPMLSEGECNEILADWNANRVIYPDGLAVHHLFEAQVERSPQQPAVIQGRVQFTYDELNRRANRLAHHLRELAVGPETPIALCAERSPEMIVGLLAILKSGGVYIPIDPDHPRTRMVAILADARVGVLLTQRSLAEKWDATNLSVIYLDATGETADDSEMNPATAVDGDNLAYILYTSGSTGTPKGVMISHAGLRNTLLWRRATFALSSSDRVLQNIPFVFDPSLWQILGTLISGATLILANHGGQYDFPHLFEQIATNAVTITDFPPSLLSELLDAPEIEDCDSLRHIFAGGEVLSPEVQQKFFSRLGAELHNVYGPTEAAIDATWWTCRRDHPASPVPIGKPIANKEIYVLDDNLYPVPVGVCGELFIGGAGLARGYVGQPDLTAQKFIPHPFGASGSRLYRTGDLARCRQGGEIEFLGRADRQVKVRGQRIELEEIERLMERHPAVQESAVVVLQSGKELRLVAYAGIGSGTTTPTARELRKHLKDNLPESMIPSAFVVLEKLPRNAAGKIDRQNLPAPDTEFASAGSVLAPRTPLEQTIAGIWQDVLALPKVGMEDNFFDLGGHSLLLVRVHQRLILELGQNLSVVDLFQYPTIGDLAQHLSRQIPKGISEDQLRRKAQQQQLAIARRQQAHRRARSLQ